MANSTHFSLFFLLVPASARSQVPCCGRVSRAEQRVPVPPRHLRVPRASRTAPAGPQAPAPLTPRTRSRSCFAPGRQSSRPGLKLRASGGSLQVGRTHRTPPLSAGWERGGGEPAADSLCAHGTRFPTHPSACGSPAPDTEDEAGFAFGEVPGTAGLWFKGVSRSPGSPRHGNFAGDQRGPGSLSQA